MFSAVKKPKLKKGAWFYKVRGSYLPATWQGWLMHLLLLLCGVSLIIIAANDDRGWLVTGTTFILSLIGVGAVFTWFDAKKS